MKVQLLYHSDPVLVLDLRLDVLDRVGALDLQRDGLARQRLDEDLHCVLLVLCCLRGESQRQLHAGGGGIVLIATGEQQGFRQRRRRRTAGGERIVLCAVCCGVARRGTQRQAVVLLQPACEGACSAPQIAGQTGVGNRVTATLGLQSWQQAAPGAVATE